MMFNFIGSCLCIQHLYNEMNGTTAIYYTLLMEGLAGRKFNKSVVHEFSLF